MSTNLVHLLTVVGKAATEVVTACETLLARRIERDPNAFGSDDWSAEDRKEIDAFAESLIRTAPHLPTVYYSQHLDGWSVANSFYSQLEWPDDGRRLICGDSLSLAFYPSAICLDLLGQIKKLRRRKFYREQAEDRWLLDRLWDAIHAVLWLEAPFVVISISQVLGPSRQDEEIRAALDLSMWLPEA